MGDLTLYENIVTDGPRWSVPISSVNRDSSGYIAGADADTFRRAADHFEAQYSPAPLSMSWRIVIWTLGGIGYGVGVTLLIAMLLN